MNSPQGGKIKTTSTSNDFDIDNITQDYYESVHTKIQYQSIMHINGTNKTQNKIK